LEERERILKVGAPERASFLSNGKKKNGKKREVELTARGGELKEGQTSIVLDRFRADLDTNHGRRVFGAVPLVIEKIGPGAGPRGT